jgi:hypothetical protein
LDRVGPLLDRLVVSDAWIILEVVLAVTAFLVAVELLIKDFF